MDKYFSVPRKKIRKPCHSFSELIIYLLSPLDRDGIDKCLPPPLQANGPVLSCLSGSRLLPIFRHCIPRDGNCSLAGAAANMKLIRWVEVHIGRRKHKREDGSLAPPTRKSEATPPDTPRLTIRTSLLESPAARRLESPRRLMESPRRLESPRARTRIRTNPWLPSPRSSDRWRAASVGSESSESICGFGSQSSGLWEGDPCSRSTPRLPRVSLEPRAGGAFYDEDTPYCPATYCRPIPRSAWVDFRELQRSDKVDQDEAGESSDEAYSEDYVHKELSLDVRRTAKPPESPQADSACGSGSDNSSSCSTTPVSEEGGPSPSVQEEQLQDKVARLQRARRTVDRRLQEARQEELQRREEQLLLQRELVQFRRLFLMQTLAELRHQLERKRLEGE
ncbi:hypothetical protein JTE90_016868 [Oedothorax gibbosus]|uniref:Uncharacterized protein n=1 Tax=Oedothorax gibbosus TaxID=931172 RepID=A0AAV6VZC0_9ARAC|nr:hypothetical protein JTE90_016868 [Oedothorax gibbosus]